MAETGQTGDPRAIARAEEIVAHKDDPADHAAWRSEITGELAG
jgi:hypothetical protein